MRIDYCCFIKRRCSWIDCQNMSSRREILSPWRFISLRKRYNAWIRQPVLSEKYKKSINHFMYHSIKPKKTIRMDHWKNHLWPPPSSSSPGSSSSTSNLHEDMISLTLAEEHQTWTPSEEVYKWTVSNFLYEEINLLFCFLIKMHHFHDKPLIFVGIIRCDPSSYL